MEDFPFSKFFSQSLETLDPAKKQGNIELKESGESFNTPQDDDLKLLQETIFQELNSIIPEQKYESFFKGTLKLTSMDNNSVTFVAKTAFVKSVVSKNYLNEIHRALENAMGKSLAIQFVVSGSKEEPQGATFASPSEEVPAGLSQNTTKQASFKLDLKPGPSDVFIKAESDYLKHTRSESQGITIDRSKTFDKFVVGPSNNMAFATAKAVSSQPGKEGKYPTLYIYSNSGLGKTHLLHSVANEIHDHFPELALCLVTATDFIGEMIHSIQNNQVTEFRKKYSEDIDVLMIDDIHELKGKQRTQEEFFYIFNELHLKGKQLIFTSDKAPSEIDGLEERIRTRLQWGLVIDIQKPDLETRIAILKRKAKEIDLFISEDVLALIASAIKSSIRELEGSLIKLKAFNDVLQVEFDKEMVIDLLGLKDILEQRKLTFDNIAKAVSKYFDVPVTDLKSKSRNKEITKPRHIAMFLSRKLLQVTQEEIGKFYGGRDHSSVLHALKKITGELKSDTQLAHQLVEIENNL